jgi:hypothetical protein
MVFDSTLKSPKLILEMRVFVRIEIYIYGVGADRELLCPQIGHHATQYHHQCKRYEYSVFHHGK